MNNFLELLTLPSRSSSSSSSWKEDPTQTIKPMTAINQTFSFMITAEVTAPLDEPDGITPKTSDQPVIYICSYH